MKDFYLSEVSNNYSNLFNISTLVSLDFNILFSSKCKSKNNYTTIRDKIKKCSTLRKLILKILKEPLLKLLYYFFK